MNLTDLVVVNLDLVIDLLMVLLVDLLALNLKVELIHLAVVKVGPKV